MACLHRRPRPGDVAARHEAKLEKAKQLLVESRVPLGEMPGFVGFESAPYFTRFFKRRTGMSMREWRRRQ